MKAIDGSYFRLLREAVFAFRSGIDGGYNSDKIRPIKLLISLGAEVVVLFGYFIALVGCDNVMNHLEVAMEKAGASKKWMTSIQVTSHYLFLGLLMLCMSVFVVRALFAVIRNILRCVKDR